MDRKIERMARTGFVAKGSVYTIVGVLTFLAAFNLGGQKTGKLEVLQYLDKQPFGNALLITIGLGLICYSLWRFFESIKDPENIGSDKKAMIKRTAFFVSGCIYLVMGALAIWRVIGSGRSGSSGNTAQQSHFLATNTGLIILGIAGAIIIATGIAQFVKVYRGDFLKKFDLKSISEEKRRKTIKNSGYFGLSSRGIIFIIVGYFGIHAALTSNPSEIKTTSEVFAFLRESSYGPWLMGVVAAGLVGYSIFLFMMALYRKFR